MSIFELEAESRSDMGKGASRRLRRDGKVPAIIYGGGEDPQAITLVHSEILKRVDHEAFYSHILSLNVDGKKLDTVLRDMQRHPSKPVVMHMDFQRVQADEVLRVNVPLHFIGENDSPGVKMQHGVVTHNIVDIEIECLPGNLPEYIEVDCSGLEIGDSIHLTGLKAPNGVKFVDLLNFEQLDEEEQSEIDQTVVMIVAPRVETEEGEAGEAGIPAGEQKPAEGKSE
jgi:large subunit ribosomal protein L25